MHCLAPYSMRCLVRPQMVLRRPDVLRVTCGAATSFLKPASFTRPFVAKWGRGVVPSGYPGGSALLGP
jgi:hypothetical protein